VCSGCEGASLNPSLGNSIIFTYILVMAKIAFNQLAITVAFDATNKVWFVADTDLPGLCVETATLDEMKAVIDDLAPDLLETNVPIHKRDWPLRIQHMLEPRRATAA
jgi:hypothetical protein